jgi:hypothetical protein
MKSRHYIFAAKIILIIWGFYIYFIGALYRAFGTGDDSYFTVLGATIFLTYCSPFLCGLIDLLSSRIASVLQLVAALVAIVLVLSTHVESRALSVEAWIHPIAYGPIATALALFAIFGIEKHYGQLILHRRESGARPAA